METYRTADEPSHVSDRELGLADYAAMIWRRRLAIVAATLVVAAVAFIVSARATPSYEASVTVMVSPSKMGEGPELPVAISSFRALMENRAIAAAVIRDNGLDKAPYSLTATEFANRNLNVDEIRGTNYLRVRVKLKDPATAATVANQLVQRGIELNTRLNQQEDLTTRDFMKQELDQTSARMETLAKELADFKREAQIEVVKGDAQDLLDQRGKLVQLNVDIEAERARLAKAQEELARQPETLSATRSRDLETAMSQAARRDNQAQPPTHAETPAPEPRTRLQQSEGADQRTARSLAAGSGVSANSSAPAATVPGEPLSESQRPSAAGGSRPSAAAVDPWIGVELGSGVVNPVHEILQYQIVTSRARLSSLERQRQELTERLKLGGAGISKVRELHDKQSELEKRQLEYELAAKIYADVASRYEQARIRVASKSAQLSILDPAVVPDSPLGPRPLLIGVMAAAVAFLLATVVALLYETITRPRLA